jgi:hypothetical protein
MSSDSRSAGNLNTLFRYWWHWIAKKYAGIKQTDVHINPNIPQVLLYDLLALLLQIELTRA